MVKVPCLKCELVTPLPNKGQVILKKICDNNYSLNLTVHKPAWSCTSQLVYRASIFTLLSDSWKKTQAQWLNYVILISLNKMLQTLNLTQIDIYIIMILTIYFKTSSDKDKRSKIWDKKN